MAFRLSLGQYCPTDSRIHGLDPRAKVAATLAIMLSSFLVRTPAQLAFSWASLIIATAMTRVPVTKVVRSIMPVLAVTAALGLLNLLLVREGETLVTIGPIAITSGGAWAALLYPLRLVVAVLAVTILLLTTTPTRLTDAFDAFLSPLSRIGLPGHELAMVFSLMLRFIPTLANEASAILDAQAIRGAGLGEGGIAGRVRSVVPVTVSLLASAIRHATNLSRALDARHYVGGAARTHWHPLHMCPADWCALAVTGAYLAALVALA